jgi:hypothetical protein
MKKLLYLLSLISLSLLFFSCWDVGYGSNIRSFYVTNNSSYDLYFTTRLMHGSFVDSLQEVNWGQSLDGGKETDVGYVKFYHKRTPEQLEDGYFVSDDRLFIITIEDGNSVVTIIEDNRDDNGNGDVKYRLVITNEMLGLPPLTGGE